MDINWALIFTKVAEGLIINSEWLVKWHVTVNSGQN